MKKNEYTEPDYNLLDKLEVVGETIKIPMPICMTIKNGIYFKDFDERYIDILFNTFDEFNKFIESTIEYKESLKTTVGVVLKSEYKDGRYLGTSVLRYDGIHISVPRKDDTIELSFAYKRDLEYFIEQLLNIKEKLYEQEN